MIYKKIDKSFHAYDFDILWILYWKFLILRPCFSNMADWILTSSEFIIESFWCCDQVFQIWQINGCYCKIGSHGFKEIKFKEKEPSLNPLSLLSITDAGEDSHGIYRNGGQILALLEPSHKASSTCPFCYSSMEREVVKETPMELTQDQICLHLLQENRSQSSDLSSPNSTLTDTPAKHH